MNLSCNFLITSILCFVSLGAKSIICLKTTYCTEKITQTIFFQNRNAHTGPLFKNAKILKFSGKVSLENCVLIRKSLHKTLPKILCDWFTLCFESITHSTRWTSNGFINVPSHRTKSYGRYSVTINVIYTWNVF